MLNFKDVLLKGTLLCTLIILIWANSAFGSALNTLNSKCIFKDTVIVYDTLFVFDTVWEYTYVYDTVWIYDTVHKAQQEHNNLEYMTPIKASYLHLSHFHYRSNKLNTSRIYNPTKVKKVKTNKYYNFRIKQRFNKQIPQQKQVQTPLKLTLNPTAGSFNPSIFKRGIYSFDGYSGLFMQNTSYINEGDSELTQSIEKATTNLTGSEFGVRANYNLFQFGAQTGIGIMNIREQFTYQTIQTNVDSTLNGHFITDSLWYTEYISFVNMDSLIINGTIVYDSLLNENFQIDTTFFYNYDTTENITVFKPINRHRIIEIPIIFTYEFAYNKSSFQLKLGGINQIHLISKGKTFISNGVTTDIMSSKYTLYNFSIYVGLGYVYDLNKKLSITIDGYYKHPTRIFYSSSILKLKNNYVGINAAIRYRFNK